MIKIEDYAIKIVDSIRYVRNLVMFSMH